VKIIAKIRENETTETISKTVVIASTAAPDRYGDIVDQATWKLDRYNANPIIQWGHRYDLPPIGKAHVGVHDGELLAEITWDTGEHNALANTVASQFENGFLSAVSVGFMPGHAVKRSSLEQDDPRYAPAGMVYFAPELLEISAVPIPANPESLAQRGLPDTAIIREVRIELAEGDEEDVREDEEEDDERDEEEDARSVLKDELMYLISEDEDVRRVLRDLLINAVEEEESVRESICTLVYPEPEPLEVADDCLVRLLAMAGDAKD